MLQQWHECWRQRNSRKCGNSLKNISPAKIAIDCFSWCSCYISLCVKIILYIHPNIHMYLQCVKLVTSTSANFQMFNIFEQTHFGYVFQKLRKQCLNVSFSISLHPFVCSMFLVNLFLYEIVIGTSGLLYKLT